MVRAQDALIVCVRWLGIPVVQTQVHKDLAVENNGELTIGRAVLYARDKVRYTCYERSNS